MQRHVITSVRRIGTVMSREVPSRDMPVQVLQLFCVYQGCANASSKTSQASSDMKTIFDRAVSSTHHCRIAHLHREADLRCQQRFYH